MDDCRTVDAPLDPDAPVFGMDRYILVDNAGRPISGPAGGAVLTPEACADIHTLLDVAETVAGSPLRIAPVNQDALLGLVRRVRKALEGGEQRVES